MPAVITTENGLACPHNGAVTMPESGMLTVNKHIVLVKSEVEGKAVSGCKTPSDESKGNGTCTLVQSVSSGLSSKLTVNSKPVILDTLDVSTNGMVTNKTQKIKLTTVQPARLTAT